MSELRVRSLSVEVEHADGSGTIVVRDPLGAAPSAYVAGALSLPVAEEALSALGMGATELLVAGGIPRHEARGAPSRPGLVRALEAPLSRPSAPRSSGQRRYQGPDALSDLLEELAHAVLRTGRQNPTTTVEELLEVAWLACAGHAPLARLLTRLEASLSPHAPALSAALALAAASEVVARLRDPEDALHDETSGRTAQSPLEPCELLELGRRHERGSIDVETRILLDMSSGELLAESPSRPTARLSRGPVGRHLSVTFGRRILAAGIPRVEIQHYEYEPAPTVEQLERVQGLASAGASAAPGSALSLIPLPKPVFVQLESLDAPARRVVCANGAELDLDDGSCPGALSALLELTLQGARVEALLGTLELVPRASGRGLLALAPWSALERRRGTPRLVPLSY